MCISPLYIPNPNKGKPKVGFNLLKDCTSEYIPVPCGHCPQCIAIKQLGLIQRVQMESLDNYLFFATLTYSDEALPHIVVNDYDIRFADISDIQNTFKRLRKYNSFTRPFRYICVSELGSKRGRPHFHLIISIPKYQSDDVYTPFNLENILSSSLLREWRRNYGSNRKPIYRDNCNYVRRFVHGRISYNFDLHYIAPSFSTGGVADPAFYCLKYLLKKSDREVKLQQALHLNLSSEAYAEVWKIVKTRHNLSKGFGLTKVYDVDLPSRKIDKFSFSPSIAKHIRMGIDFSFGKFQYPVYIHPDTGVTFPLSKFYKKYFLTPDDAFRFWTENLNNSPYVDSIADAEYKELHQTLSVIDKYNNQCRILDGKQFY